MPENQNIEWKQSWHDDYLKWICGFANASGGILEIGRNDKTGAIVGKTWDGVPVPHLKLDDFESDAFKAFRRKAVASA